MPPLAAAQPLYYDENGNPIYEDPTLQAPSVAPATAPVPPPTTELAPAGTAAPPTTTVQYPTAGASSSQYGAPEQAVGYGEQVPVAPPPAAIDPSQPTGMLVGSAAVPEPAMVGADAVVPAYTPMGGEPNQPSATAYPAQEYLYQSERNRGTFEPPYEPLVPPGTPASPSFSGPPDYSGVSPSGATINSVENGQRYLRPAAPPLASGYWSPTSTMTPSLSEQVRGSVPGFDPSQWPSLPDPVTSLSDLIIGALPGGLQDYLDPEIDPSHRGLGDVGMIGWGGGGAGGAAGAAGRAAARDASLAAIDRAAAREAALAAVETPRVRGGKPVPRDVVAEPVARGGEPIPRTVTTEPIVRGGEPLPRTVTTRPIVRGGEPIPREVVMEPTVRGGEPRPREVVTEPIVRGGEPIPPTKPPVDPRVAEAAAKMQDLKIREQILKIANREDALTKAEAARANPEGDYVPTPLDTALAGTKGQVIEPPIIPSNAFEPRLTKTGVKRSVEPVINPQLPALPASALGTGRSIGSLREIVGPALKPAATLAALITGMAGAVKAGQKGEELAGGWTLPVDTSGGAPGGEGQRDAGQLLADFQTMWGGGGQQGSWQLPSDQEAGRPDVAPSSFRTIGTPYPGSSEAPLQPPYNTLELSAPQQQEEYGADNPNYPEPNRGWFDNMLRGTLGQDAANQVSNFDAGVNAGWSDVVDTVSRGGFPALQDLISGGMPTTAPVSPPAGRSTVATPTYRPTWGGTATAPGAPAHVAEPGEVIINDNVRGTGVGVIGTDREHPTHIVVNGERIPLPDGTLSDDATAAENTQKLLDFIAEQTAGGETSVSELSGTGTVSGNAPVSQPSISPQSGGLTSGGTPRAEGQRLSSGVTESTSNGGYTGGGGGYTPRGGGYSGRGGGGYSSRGGGGYSGGGGFGGFGPNFPFDNVPRPGGGFESPIRMQIKQMIAEMMAGMGQGMQMGQMGQLGKRKKKGEEDEEPFLLKSQRGSPYYQPGIRR